MDTLMALAVSIGVLIALWVKFGGLLAPGLAIAVPTGIVAWACFFAAGGKVQGLQKAISWWRSRWSRAPCSATCRRWERGCWPRSSVPDIIGSRMRSGRRRGGQPKKNGGVTLDSG